MSVTSVNTDLGPGREALRSNALIADAIENALRRISIAKSTRIRQIRIDPTYAVEFDGALLHARVRVELTLFFETHGGER